MLGQPIWGSESVKMNENRPEGIGLDDILDSLGNERRRIAIATIASEGMASTRELAIEISGAERGDEYDRAYISLYQCHLPKLENYGVIEEVDERYTFGPNGPEALDALRRLECEDAGNDSRIRNLLRPVLG